MCAVLAACLPAARAADKPLNILLVGNSYIGGIKSTFRTLAAASRRPIHAEYIHPGGKTLMWHAGNKKLHAKLEARRWDVVVLQDQSQTPAYFPERTLNGAKKLQSPIKAAGARTVLFQTWGRRDGDKHNIKTAPDFLTMQKLLTAGYAAAAKATAAAVAPVGETWKKVHQKDKELFRRLYSKDGSHPSALGGYLAACVIYRATTGSEPPDNAVPPGVSAKEAGRLRAFAAAR